MIRGRSPYWFLCWLCLAPSALAEESDDEAEISAANGSVAEPGTAAHEAVPPSPTPPAGAPASVSVDEAPSSAPGHSSDRNESTSTPEGTPPVPMDMAQVRLHSNDAQIRFSARAELGTLMVAAHKIQFGAEGTSFDYVRDGGQENLFPFARFSAEANLFRHHNLVFLFQPLTLETDIALRDTLDVYDARYDAGTAMHLKYGFDFVRFSYFYDFWQDPRQELGFGASLQIRNAIINFNDVAGTRLVSNRNVGPVPILKARWRSTFANDVFMGAEIDGFYANIPIANGDLESQVEGAICDASVRLGFPVTGFANAFINLRYLGGGSSGFERGDDIEGDGFTDNWLHTFAISLGAELN